MGTGKKYPKKARIVMDRRADRPTDGMLQSSVHVTKKEEERERKENTNEYASITHVGDVPLVGS